MPAILPIKVRDNLVRQYLETDAPVREIAEQNSCGVKAIYDELKRRKIELRPSRYAPEKRTGRNIRNLVGKRFGSLVVLRCAGVKSVGSRNSTALWLCKCDCGAEKVLRANSLTSSGTRTCGAPIHHPNWNEGRRKDRDGYMKVYRPDHPHARKDKCIPEHRLVMEQSLGRLLKPNETVHHKNGVRNDNRIENLELWDGKHCPGARVADRITDAVNYLREHAPHLLSEAALLSSDEIDNLVTCCERCNKKKGNGTTAPVRVFGRFREEVEAI